MKNYFDRLFYFFLLSFFFLLLACLNIEKPTPDWEEVILPSPAISILKDKPISSQFTTIQIAGKHWPIMEIDWIGAIESYLMLPIYGIFGVSIYTLRITEIFLSLIIGLLFGYLAFIMFNVRVARVATTCILFNATYLLYGRGGFDGVMLVLWMACALSLLFFWKWVKSKKNYWLYLATFTMGLGMYGKLHFLWIATGIIFGGILLIRAQFNHPTRKTDIIKAISAFILGFSPYIIENIRTQGSEIRSLIYLFLHPTDGSSNLGYFKYLGIRFKQIIEAIQGTNYYNESLLIRWLKTAPVIFISTLILSRVRKKLGDQEKPLLFLLVCILFFMFGVAFKGTPLGWNHVFVVLPMILICSGVMLSTLFKNRYSLIFIVSIILIPDFFIINNYQLALKHTKENMVLELANWLSSERIYDPIIVNDWRLAVVINTISKGEVFPIEGQLVGEKKYEEYMEDRKRTYILAKKLDSFDREKNEQGWLKFNKAFQKSKRKLSALKEYLIDGKTVSIFIIE